VHHSEKKKKVLQVVYLPFTLAAEEQILEQVPQASRLTQSSSSIAVSEGSEGSEGSDVGTAQAVAPKEKPPVSDRVAYLIEILVHLLNQWVA
jgi:hypothetical protein